MSVYRKRTASVEYPTAYLLIDTTASAFGSLKKYPLLDVTIRLAVQGTTFYLYYSITNAISITRGLAIPE